MTNCPPINDLTYDRATDEYRFNHTDGRDLLVDVVLVIAELTGADPLEMDPIYYAVSPEFLDDLADARIEVSFTYRDLGVTITPGNTVVLSQAG